MHTERSEFFNSIVPQKKLFKILKIFHNELVYRWERVKNVNENGSKNLIG